MIYCYGLNFAQKNRIRKMHAAGVDNARIARTLKTTEPLVKAVLSNKVNKRRRNTPKAKEQPKETPETVNKYTE